MGKAFDPIGDRVRAELDRTGMSMGQLADAAGVPAQGVKDWLCGRRGLRSDRVAAVLVVLGLEVRAQPDQMR